MSWHKKKFAQTTTKTRKSVRTSINSLIKSRLRLVGAPATIHSCCTGRYFQATIDTGLRHRNTSGDKKMRSMVIAPADTDAWRVKMNRKRRARQIKAFRTAVMDLLENTAVQVVLIIMLIVSLYIPDIWIVGDFPSSQDVISDGIMTAFLVVFLLELALLSFASKDYFLHFFFWADAIAVATFIFDIHYMSSTFMPDNYLTSAATWRAARAAKLGIRYSRLARLVKMIRSANTYSCMKRNSDEQQKVVSTSSSAAKKVSNTLTSLLAKQVTVMVFMLVVALPFLQYYTHDYSANAWLDSIATAVNGGATQADIDILADDFHRFYRHKDITPLKLAVTGFANYHWDNNVARRSNKVDYSNKVVQSTFDYTDARQKEAAFGMAVTSLVLFMLVGFGLTFYVSIEELIVGPLERMMLMVRNSCSLMLKSIQVMETDDKSVSEGLSQFGDALETEALEQMLEKLTSIVGHVLPGASEKYVEGAGADKDTANWLNQQYNGGVIRRPEVRMRRSSVSFITDNGPINAVQMTASVNTERLNQWSFDVLECNEVELYDVLLCLFTSTNAVEELGVTISALQAFSREIGFRYLPNPYHNMKHGVDVCHTTYLFLLKSRSESNFSTVEKLAVLMAAYAHDVGHPGVNNAYLVSTKHELAFLHNDKSPLENMHCTVLYEVLRKPDANVFQKFTDEQWRDARKVMLSAILGTDMVNHFDQISKLQVFAEVNAEQLLRMSDESDEDVIPVFQEAQNRLFFLEMLVHCADISNPIKPFNICEKWAYLVCEEFFNQGEKEKAERLPISPMMDKSKVNIPTMQCNFIDFVITPLYLAFIRCIPPFHELGKNLANNFEEWGNKRIEELKSDPATAGEQAKFADQIKKFKAKLAFCEAKVLEQDV